MTDGNGAPAPIHHDLTDQATPPVSPVQSTTASNQNASYPIVERGPEPKLSKSVLTRITSENARTLALKSHETRRAAKAAAEAERLAAIPSAPVPQADNFTATSLERVKKQLEAIDDALDKAKDGREWDQLSRAKERLFRAWVHLAGIPGPGNLRPVASNRRRATPSDLAPLPISPTDGQ